VSKSTPSRRRRTGRNVTKERWATRRKKFIFHQGSLHRTEGNWRSRGDENTGKSSLNMEDRTNRNKENKCHKKFNTPLYQIGITVGEPKSGSS